LDRHWGGSSLTLDVRSVGEAGLHSRGECLEQGFEARLRGGEVVARLQELAHEALAVRLHGVHALRPRRALALVARLWREARAGRERFELARG